MLDGLVSESEWSQAAEFESGWSEGKIWIKPESRYVYICITSLDTAHSGLDLYVDNMTGTVFMLHISSAQGHRFLSDAHWQEMTWGPTGLWASNLVQAVFKDGRRVHLIPEAFEFQISRELLPAGRFKFMLHFKRPEQWVPKNADTLSSDNWLRYGVDADTR